MVNGTARHLLWLCRYEILNKVSHNHKTIVVAVKVRIFYLRWWHIAFLVRKVIIKLSLFSLTVISIFILKLWKSRFSQPQML